MASTLSRAACALLAAALIAACGSSSPAPTTSSVPQKATTAATAASKPLSGAVTVSIKNYMFSPMKLTVKAGTKITFHNYDQTAHTATALNGSFDSGTIQPGKSSTVTVTKTGTDSYHCLFHAFMVATITVVPS